MAYPDDLPLPNKDKVTLLALTKQNAAGRAATFAGIYSTSIRHLLERYVVHNGSLLDEAVKRGFLSGQERAELLTAATELVVYEKGGDVLDKTLTEQSARKNETWEKDPYLADRFRAIEKLAFFFPFMYQSPGAKGQTIGATASLIKEHGDMTLEEAYSQSGDGASFYARMLGVNRRYVAA